MGAVTTHFAVASRLATALPVAAALAAILQPMPARAAAADEFHYDEGNAGTAAYFAAISNLANAVMFSGLGEALIVSPYERDEWLRRAGFVTRPAMPDMAAVGPVYAAGQPEFAHEPDFARPRTLAWDSGSFDRTLDPGAQAWAMIKITSPEFHLQYHDLPDNRLAGLMMVPQARAQAQTLERRLLNPDGLFAPLGTDGSFGDPRPRDQAAVLWAASNLILAATDTREDYWHAAYRDLTVPEDYHGLANKAFAAVEKLPPNASATRGVAIEALGRFALATSDEDTRASALHLARTYANLLAGDPGNSSEDIALAVYGLTEAGRLLDDSAYAEAANAIFRDRLLPSWDEDAALFRSEAGTLVYSPRSIGAVVAALDAMRWYGPDGAAAEARRIYPRFFESAVIRSGLMRASPLPLVAKPYLDEAPPETFAHPALPDAAAMGTAPVFAAEAAYENGVWKVTDPTFRTADALFLANMLAMRSEDRADTFLPEHRLAALR